jgi:hypothetical protein
MIMHNFLGLTKQNEKFYIRSKFQYWRENYMALCIIYILFPAETWQVIYIT